MVCAAPTLENQYFGSNLMNDNVQTIEIFNVARFPRITWEGKAMCLTESKLGQRYKNAFAVVSPVETHS